MWIPLHIAQVLCYFSYGKRNRFLVFNSKFSIKVLEWERTQWKLYKSVQIMGNAGALFSYNFVLSFCFWNLKTFCLRKNYFNWHHIWFLYIVNGPVVGNWNFPLRQSNNTFSSFFNFFSGWFWRNVLEKLKMVALQQYVTKTSSNVLILVDGLF